MDPYYFFDNIKISDNNDNLELHDICDYTIDGSWSLGQEDIPLIIYENKKYNFINFNNESKEIYFILNNNLVMTKKLTIV
jgi:hypothetical protein